MIDKRTRSPLRIKGQTPPLPMQSSTLSVARVFGYDFADEDVYLVGGAVRDTLLGRPFTEHDYVVVGATPDDLHRARLSPGGQGLSRCSCTRRPATSTRSPARSARPARATTASQRDSRPTSRSRRISRAATSRSTPWRATTRARWSIRTAADAISKRGCCVTCRPRSSRTRCACCAWRDSRRGTRRSVSAIAPETMALMTQIVRSGRDAGAGGRARLGRDRARARRGTTDGLFRSAAGVRRARRAVPGNRPPLRRAAAAKSITPRSTPASTPCRCSTSRCELSADTTVRFAALVHDLGKGATPPARVAPPHRPRPRRRRDHRAALRAAEGAERTSRARACWRRASIRNFTAPRNCATRRYWNC